jgi:S1-C subfamily serine protease
MKATRLVLGLLTGSLLATASLSAQTTQTNNFQELKAKAEKGDASAQGRLGMIYLTADGVERNNSEAFKFFNLAAKQGDEAGLKGLCMCYEGGYGVPIDYAKAFEITRKLAEAGDNNEQRNLGIKYEDGTGVRQDYVEAYKWYNIAAANENLRITEAMEKEGFEPASKQRDRLAKLMTAEQIAEAQRLSHEFKPRKVSDSANSDSSESPIASGSGFFITEDGYLITNEHVVKDATRVRLVTSAGPIAAKVVKVDAANDLALLKAEGRFASLPIASSRTVKLGGTVATVGFPNIGLQGFAPKLAKGEIASLSGATDDARYFQISVPVQPGNSGGALVDERGNVVGIVAAKLSAAAALDATGALPENVNYAVKSSFLLSFLESVPDVASKLKEPNMKEEKFEDVVKSAQDAAVLVLVY